MSFALSYHLSFVLSFQSLHFFFLVLSSFASTSLSLNLLIWDLWRPCQVLISLLLPSILILSLFSHTTITSKLVRGKISLLYSLSDKTLFIFLSLIYLQVLPFLVSEPVIKPKRKGLLLFGQINKYPFLHWSFAWLPSDFFRGFVLQTTGHAPGYVRPISTLSSIPDRFELTFPLRRSCSSLFQNVTNLICFSWGTLVSSKESSDPITQNRLRFDPPIPSHVSTKHVINFLTHPHPISRIHVTG